MSPGQVAERLKHSAVRIQTQRERLDHEEFRAVQWALSNGLTLTAVGRLYGKSRQAMSRWYARRVEIYGSGEEQ